jgi:hypothetical protein
MWGGVLEATGAPKGRGRWKQGTCEPSDGIAVIQYPAEIRCIIHRLAGRQSKICAGRGPPQ